MDIARLIAKLVQVAAKFIMRGLKSKKASEPIETAQTAQAKEASKTASTSASASVPKRLPPMKPPKPSRECINDFGVDGKFMLCGDFVESKSHAMEVEILYVYEPDCDEPFARYDSQPYFMITSGLDEVCCSYEDFVGINVDDIIKFDADDEKEFYAEIDYYGDRMALYNYTRYFNDIGDKEYFALCVVYSNDYVGTEYEKHFLNVLKEAAETYREIVNAE